MAAQLEPVSARTRWFSTTLCEVDAVQWLLIEWTCMFEEGYWTFVFVHPLVCLHVDISLRHVFQLFLHVWYQAVQWHLRRADSFGMFSGELFGGSSKTATLDFGDQSKHQVPSWLHLILKTGCDPAQLPLVSSPFGAVGCIKHTGSGVCHYCRNENWLLMPFS